MDASRGTLFATQFDLDRLEVVGTPVPMVEQIRTATSAAANSPFPREGTLVYVPGSVRGVTSARELVWVDCKGREEPIVAPARACTRLRGCPPDGTRIALDIRDQESDIWVWHIDRHTLTRLTFDSGNDAEPVWTPDGRSNHLLLDPQR